MIDPAQVLAIAAFGVAALAAIGWVFAREPRGLVRHVADGDPLADGAAARHGAAAELAPIDELPLSLASLVRPYVVLRAPSAADLVTVPSPRPVLVAMNGLAVVPPVRCATCRDGQAFGALDECVWCHCPRGGWSA